MAIERVARAKVNLALHVTGRRDDGYHLLDSLVAFADIGDRITVAPAATLTLSLSGPYAKALSPTDNLVLKAARTLNPSLGAHITLHKCLPVASGIGGGSADAAATLIALASLWKMPLPSSNVIVGLGSDLPVCLLGEAARMQGIGEQVTRVVLPRLWAVLANAGAEVATKAVFSALLHRENAALPPIASPFVPWLQTQRNDLQAAAIQIAPVIATTLQALNGLPDCQIARMSGSGATCFALFGSEDKSSAAAAALQADHPTWWVRATALS